MKFYFLLITFMVYAYSFAQKASSTHVTITIDDSKKDDTCVLVIYPNAFAIVGGTHVYAKGTEQKTILKAVKDHSGNFTFQIPYEPSPRYLSAYRQEDIDDIGVQKELMHLYLLETGDQVNIHLLRNIEPIGAYHIYKLHFSGPGSAKYEFQNDMELFLLNNENGDENNLKSLNRMIDSLRSSMSPAAWQITKINLLSQFYYLPFFELYEHLVWSKRSDSLIPSWKNQYQKLLLTYKIPFPDKQLVYSKNYDAILILQLRISSLIQFYDTNVYSSANPDSFALNAYSQLKTKYAGSVLRDKLLTNYVKGEQGWNDQADSLVLNCYSNISSEYCRVELRKLIDGLFAGAKAYDFSLTDTAGHSIKYADYKGKVVFMDFWFTGCSACSYFYQHALSGIEEKYKNDSNVRFISVDVDMEHNTWLKSLYSGRYSSVFADNVTTPGFGHPIIDHYNIQGYPRPLLISRSGIIISSSLRELTDSSRLDAAISKTLQSK